MTRRRYLWQPAVHEQCRGTQPGGVVELTDEQRVYNLRVVPGLDGQPCLVLLDEPTPATPAEVAEEPLLDEPTPATPRRRKPRVEG